MAHDEKAEGMAGRTEVLTTPGVIVDDGLVGAALPSGRACLPRYITQLWESAVSVAGAPPSSSEVDPLLAQYLVMSAGGNLVEILLSMLGADQEPGMMVGEIDLTSHVALTADETYDVTGTITSLESHTGRRLGPFDALTFEHEIREVAEGEVVAALSQTWIFFLKDRS